MLLTHNTMQIGHQKDAFNWDKTMLLGCKPILLAKKTQVFILFAYRFFLNWKFVSAVFRTFFGKKSRRYTYYNV